MSLEIGNPNFLLSLAESSDCTESSSSFSSASETLSPEDKDKSSAFSEFLLLSW